MAEERSYVLVSPTVYMEILKKAQSLGPGPTQSQIQVLLLKGCPMEAGLMERTLTTSLVRCPAWIHKNRSQIQRTAFNSSSL